MQFLIGIELKHSLTQQLSTFKGNEQYNNLKIHIFFPFHTLSSQASDNQIKLSHHQTNQTLVIGLREKH